MYSCPSHQPSRIRVSHLAPSRRQIHNIPSAPATIVAIIACSWSAARAPESSLKSPAVMNATSAAVPIPMPIIAKPITVAVNLRRQRAFAVDGIYTTRCLCSSAMGTNPHTTHTTHPWPKPATNNHPMGIPQPYQHQREKYRSPPGSVAFAPPVPRRPNTGTSMAVFPAANTPAVRPVPDPWLKIPAVWLPWSITKRFDHCPAESVALSGGAPPAPSSLPSVTPVPDPSFAAPETVCALRCKQS